MAVSPEDKWLLLDVDFMVGLHILPSAILLTNWDSEDTQRLEHCEPTSQRKDAVSTFILASSDGYMRRFHPHFESLKDGARDICP